MDEEDTTPTVSEIKLYDLRGANHKIQQPPTVHIARHYDRHLPFLKSGRPLICISDWQYEPDTQRHFWDQALPILEEELGGRHILERAIVIVAGDMASGGNRLRGPASDAAPILDWLYDSFPYGDVFTIYGNHDDMAQQHLEKINSASSGLPCVLPHGSPVIQIPLSGSERVDKHDIRDASTGKESQLAISTATIAHHDLPSPLKKTPTKNTGANITPGMTKEERAAQYAKMKFEKKPKLSKLERQTKQWRHQNPDQALLADRFKSMHVPKDGPKTVPSGVDGKTAVRKLNKNDGSNDTNSSTPERLRVGAVHGIPASHDVGMKKIERKSYFRELAGVFSSDIDVLVTHSNPRLPGQEGVVHGDDPGMIYDLFQSSSSAKLHIHGHMHLDPAISILPNKKVVVNSDCRVVAFVPP